MYPSDFEYLTPASLSEAVSMLEMRKGEAKLLAGGHTLIPLMNDIHASVEYRTYLAKVYTMRALRRAAARAKGS